MKLAKVAVVLGLAMVATAPSMRDAHAQATTGLSAKALFYDADGKLSGVDTGKKVDPPLSTGNQVAAGSSAETPKAAAKSSAVRPLALRATVLLVTDGGGTREIKPSHKFKSSDRIKLAFTSSKTGYFYLATVGSTGKIQVLAPRANEAAILEPGFRYVFPSSPTAFFRFDGNVGKEELWAILSDAPLSAINMGGGQVAEIPAPATQPYPTVALANKTARVADVSSELAGKDLVFEEDNNALYASAKPVAYTPAGTGKPSVIVKLTLSHE